MCVSLFLCCSPRLDLNERIEYLSRAMMCAKSCNLPTSSSHEGEFLHELEESMEVRGSSCTEAAVHGEGGGAQKGGKELKRSM